MPPRPPLSSSSSFTLLPLSDVHSSVDQQSPSNHLYPKQAFTSSYDDIYPLPRSDTLNRATSETHENEYNGCIYPDYGGAGHYSKPQRGRFDMKLFSATTKETMKKERKSGEGKEKDDNMTRRIATRLEASYVFRQLVYIISIGLILWIPGLLALFLYDASPQNNFDRPTVLSVGLFWWSIWLSSAWLAIWVCSILATFTPIVLRAFFGLAVAFKDIIVYAEATKRYVAFLLWSIVVWVVYLSTVWSQFPGSSTVEGSTVNPLTGSNSTASSTSSPFASLLSLVPSDLIEGRSSTLAALQSNQLWLVSLSRLLAGLIICSSILLVEKIAMQWVALSFHKTTYSDRIAMSNYYISVLTALSASASSNPSISTISSSTQDERREERHSGFSTVLARAQKFKKALSSHHNARDLAGSFGLISASLPLQSSQSPFSYQAIVATSLESATQSRKLAKQIFLAFGKSKDAKTGDNVMTEKDIASVFKTEEDSLKAFDVLDRDNNESCTWEELQARVLSMHQERICLLASLHDVDSAVLKLDNFFMSFYAFISCVIIAALLSTKFSTLVASLGTILLGLSWLVGSTAQESLASIVWVFGKHPVDVGDTIEIPGLVVSTSTVESDSIFVVEEIQLLSTILKTTTGKQVSISNAQLAQKAIVNLRRSGPTQESINIIVEYSTTLEAIEKLRTEMLKWIDTQARDFLPGLNIEMAALGDQSQLSLTLDIRYKSNWQDEHLKAIRKNRWIAALKSVMLQLEIYGPNGNPKNNQSAADGSDSLGRVASISLMDERNALKDGHFSKKRTSVEEADPPSRLNEAMPPSASSRQHSNPMTQITSLHAKARRGHGEREDDLERGQSHF